MKQKPFTAPQLKKLTENALVGEITGKSSAPVVKFFCPWGAGTWLISEAKKEGNDYILYGLCDIGHGCAEIGSLMLSDLQNMRGPFGMGIERDLHFTASKTLSDYADAAREQGGIYA